MSKQARQLDLMETVIETLQEEMSRDERVIIFGEEVALFGGAWGCSRGLLKIFGEKRVRDTPISESGIIGAAVGAAITGMRPVAELMFGDLVPVAMDQLTNQLGMAEYMFGGNFNVPVVVRCPLGERAVAGMVAGPHHNQSPEAYLMHAPGLNIVTPSTPYDAKGLLKTAIRDGHPAVFFEHLMLYYPKRDAVVAKLYPKMISEIPEEEYLIPFGKADIKREGTDVTIIGTMVMVHKALSAAEELQKRGISAEVIDPRTLVPLDKKTIVDSVKKTGKAVVVSEDWKRCGVSAEIASVIMEEAFDHLKKPVQRVAARQVPIPYTVTLEQRAVPQVEDIVAAVMNIA